MIARCTAVGRTNDNLRHVDTSGGHNPRSAKVVVNELYLLLDDCNCSSEEVLPPSSVILLSDNAAGCFRLELFRNRLDMVEYSNEYYVLQKISGWKESGGSV